MDEVDRLWVAEVQDRLEAYRRGELSVRDFKEVFAELAIGDGKTGAAKRRPPNDRWVRLAQSDPNSEDDA